MYRRYMDDLHRSKFVFSPTGKGLDCYRTWEALLMGAIPIVKSCSIDAVYEDLPVLIVQDWHDITPEFLEEQYRIISARTYNRKKLFIDYWWNKIVAVQKAAREQHGA